jgi:YfiH family protein
VLAEPARGVALHSGVIPARTPGGRPASWAATGRSGGCSLPPYDSLNLGLHVGDDLVSVGENLDLLCREIGLAGLAWPRGVHGTLVVEATAPGDLGEADAVITSESGLGIAVVGADCLLVGLAGDDDRTVAVVHCGWRGLVGDVIGATVDALAARGVRPRMAVLGPAICGSCYPVPLERAQQVHDSCPAEVADAAVIRCADGQPGIDVRLGVLARLAGLGVKADQVVSLNRCTAEDPALFSYRRDGRTGRHGLVMVSQGSIVNL